MGEIERIEVTVFSDRGTVRRNNEDNLYFSGHDIINRESEDSFEAAFSEEYSEKLILAAIFDGMGGTESGEVASLLSAQQMQLLYQELLEKRDWDEEELSDLLALSKKRMEDEIGRALNSTGGEQSGTTCCGFWMKDGLLQPFWIGDSRLYLLRQQKLMLLTKDHTVAQEKIEYGLITPEEAVTTSYWHCLTAYIGDFHNPIVLGNKISVEPGDKFLLCTDGISDKFSFDEIEEYLSDTPEKFVEQIKAGVKEECRDNATAILFHMMQRNETIGTVIKNKAKDYFTVIGEKVRENSRRQISPHGAQGVFLKP